MGFLDKCVGCHKLPSITDDPSDASFGIRILPWSKWNPLPQNLLKEEVDATADVDNVITQRFVRSDFIT